MLLIICQLYTIKLKNKIKLRNYIYISMYCGTQSEVINHVTKFQWLKRTDLNRNCWIETNNIPLYSVDKKYVKT